MTEQNKRQSQKAKRLREQIERLKSGRPIERPDGAKSLREQIEERGDRARKGRLRKSP
jgi:hypothetical protein